MKRNHITRICALLLSVVMLWSISGCGSQKDDAMPQLNMNLPGRQVSYGFSGQPSQVLQLSQTGAAAVLTAVEQQQVDYVLAHLYQLDEVKNRLHFDASVENHAYCALNDAGVLDAAHLALVVEQNNAVYMADEPFGYKLLDSGDILQICTLIVTVVEQLRQKYPLLDWDRVYCVLGELKILHDVGTLSYAEVKSDRVLAVNANNTKIVQIMKGENGFRNVLVHETVHLVQIGCSCEKIENCERRCGISVYWDDFPLNTTDWGWLFEGAAERNTCALTGEGAISYQYKMDYLCSFTMALLLRQEVAADTMETLSFYTDPQLLFDAFGCTTGEQQEEVLKLMITMNVLQMQPDRFYEEYAKDTGEDPRESEEAMNTFSYSLKPAVCVTLAKEFYENLTAFLQQEQVPVNDLFCLLQLFEGHLNQHLRYQSEEKAQINAPYITAYNAMRTALFDALETDNPGLDVEAAYAAYSLTEGENILNAALTMLPEEKRVFLAERAQWQAEMQALGVKVPAA